jgi:hypothetical protein
VSVGGGIKVEASTEGVMGAPAVPVAVVSVSGVSGGEVTAAAEVDAAVATVADAELAAPAVAGVVLAVRLEFWGVGPPEFPLAVGVLVVPRIKFAAAVNNDRVPTLKSPAACAEASAV